MENDARGMAMLRCEQCLLRSAPNQRRIGSKHWMLSSQDSMTFDCWHAGIEWDWKTLDRLCRQRSIDYDLRLEHFVDCHTLDSLTKLAWLAPLLQLTPFLPLISIVSLICGIVWCASKFHYVTRCRILPAYQQHVTFRRPNCVSFGAHSLAHFDHIGRHRNVRSTHIWLEIGIRSLQLPTC